MFKFFALSAMASAVAYAAPDPQVLVAGDVAHAAPVVPSNCAIEYEAIPTQTCTPRADTVCDTVDIDHQEIEYREICKDVTSRHCGYGLPAAGHIVAKREAEAEADPQFYAAHHGLVHAAPHAVAYAAPAATEVTVKTGCHEVTSKHCVNSPVTVTKSVPVERCHVTQVVDCVETEQKVAKTVCEEVETKVLAAHPFAYGYGHHAYGWGK